MLKRMVAVCIILLVFIVGIGIAAYMVTMYAMEKYTASTSLEMIKSLEDSVKTRMSEIDGLARQLASDVTINRVKKEKDLYQDSNFPVLHVLVNGMLDLKTYNNLIVSNFIIYPRSNMIVSRGYADDTTSFFKTKLWEGGREGKVNPRYPMWTEISPEEKEDIENSCNNFIYEVFKEGSSIKILKPMSFYDNYNSYTVIPYVKWLKNISPIFEPNGAAVIMIDSQEIADMLLTVCFSPKSYAYIMDADGVLITSTDKSKMTLNIDELDKNEGIKTVKIDKKNMIATYIVSEHNGWRYVVVNDRLTITENVQRIKTYITLIIVGFILAIIIMELVFSYNRIKPLVGVYETISGCGYKPENSQKNVFEYIKTSVNRMLNDKKELASIIDMQKPILKETISVKLIKGEYSDINEVKALLEQIGYSWHGNYFGVLIISFNGYWEKVNVKVMNELAVKKVIIREIIEKLGYGELYCDIGKTEVALVVNYNTCSLEDHKVEVEKIYQGIMKSLPGDSGVLFSIAVGGIYKGLFNITSSFYEAQHALDYANWHSNNKILWGDQLPYGENSFYYSPEFEIRLMNTVKIGDIGTTQDMLKDIFSNNFEKKQLSPNIARIFLYNLCGTLIKLTEQMILEDQKLLGEIQDLISSIDDINSIAIYEKIKEAFESLCNYAHENKKSHNVYLIQQITDYIDENYGDSNLGLTMVAEVFNISEGYLSRFFKEQKGCALSEYIEDIRMKTARDLIINSGITISEIGNKMGYNSLNSFSRAFKRYYGVNATSMREVKVEDGEIPLGGEKINPKE